MHCNAISETAPVAIIFVFNYQHGLKVDCNLLIAHPHFTVPPVAILSEASLQTFLKTLTVKKREREISSNPSLTVTKALPYTF